MKTEQLALVDLPPPERRTWPLPAGVVGTHRLSACGRYRYDLTRYLADWARGAHAAVEQEECQERDGMGWPGWEVGAVTWIMLNPSTAVAERDDPTVRACWDFTLRWRYPRMRVLNLYALRATDPAELGRVEDPGGPEGRDVLLRHLRVPGPGLTVCAWGAHGPAEARWQGLVRQAERLPPLHVLGLTRAGQPKHPLYVKRSTAPQPWDGGAT